MDRTRKKQGEERLLEQLMEDPMINPATTAAFRVTPEALQASREVREAIKHEEDGHASVAEAEDAPQKSSKPTNPDAVGTLVNVEA